MQSRQLSLAARFVPSLALIVLASLAGLLPAQSATVPPHKPTPAKIDKQLLIFPEYVVLDQWPHTLNLVNAPQNLKLLNPCQCIRIGLIATGDDRDSYLEKTQLSFRVEFAGQTDSHPLAPLAGMKQIKPEGGDFVTQMLNSINVENPIPTMASLGASAEGWCVPADAQDGTATIDAEAETPAGHEKLARAKIQIESFGTGSKRVFKDDNELNDFFMGYHYQPNPARLLPALQFFAAAPKQPEHPESLESITATFGAALKASPTAAKDFMARIGAQTGFTRVFGITALIMGGYNVDPVLKTLSDDDRKMFANPQVPDPYDFSHPEDVGMRFDMLWGMFMTTGQLSPIQKIATALAWRPDWEEFDKARKSATPIKEWTPSIGRAAAYAAAGWSLASFQQTDPLAADYIEYMIASPDTPDAVKTELKGLQTNPAFKRQDQK